MTAREDGGRRESPRIAVELACEDDALEARIRALIGARPEVQIVADGDCGQVRITDGTLDGAHEVPVIVLVDPADTVRALRSGAAGVLPIDINGDSLLAAIAAVVRGLTTLSPQARDFAFDIAPARAGLDDDGGEGDDPTQPDLTQRELDVLQLLAEGASNKVIGRRLGITAHTAKFHVASILAKLGASGRTDAVAKAMRLGLIML